jgi:hypothetical protein
MAAMTYQWRGEILVGGSDNGGKQRPSAIIINKEKMAYRQRNRRRRRDGVGGVAGVSDSNVSGVAWHR